MNSTLTEERLMMRDSARRFAMERVLPLANELDPKKEQIPQSLIDEMGEMGYFGMTMSQEYGGLGLGCFEYCLVAEEMSRAWMSVAGLMARGNILDEGFLTEEQRERFLPRIARGELLGAFSLSEPNAGSDAANISCRATRIGDEWAITGSKYWVTFADRADFILLLARTAPPAPSRKRHDGISAFVIEKPRGELPKNCQGSIIPKIGYHGWTTWELAFDDCRVPAENLVGEEGKGFQLATAALAKARAHTAARSIGLARGGLEDALKYSKERVQFGQPISEFQYTRFRLARMAVDIEAARQLMYHVCTKIDTGERSDVDAAMAKLFASEMSEHVTSEALQILGGAGYTTHFAVERYWRDARLTKIFEGTSEIQMRIISDHLLRD